jgi:AcrR family transcriptional regulator
MDDVAGTAGITRLIVYRHFPSKEALYEAVLDRVSVRLAEELGARAGDGSRVPAVRTLLSVAREDPNGFALLWRHAAREPQFADAADRVRGHAVRLARAEIRGKLGDRTRERWAADVLVSYLVSAVLHWLDDGTPRRDDEFVDLTTTATVAMVSAWAAYPPVL